MKVDVWPDEVLRQCLDVAEAPVMMHLLEQLATGSMNLRLHHMRNAIASGDFALAARLEAEAGAWEGVPVLINELADEWRQRTRG